MNKTEIYKTVKQITEIQVELNDLVIKLLNINPDEPIGESRSKMVRDYHFACDVAHYGKMVLNDDPHALYLDLAESFRE